MRFRGILLSAVAVLVAVDVSSQALPPKPAPPRVPAAKPTPPPPPVLVGIVRGPDRKPIEKALVSAVPILPEIGMRYHERLKPVWTHSDATGRFRLDLRAHERQTVRVEAPGLAAATRKDVAPGATLAFDLTAGGTIEGTVRDGDTGEPAASLRVVAWQPRAAPMPDVPEAGRVVARTDARGRFKLEGLARGSHWVTASERGRGSATRGSVRTGTRVDLVVLPAGSVYGTVLGADGKPVPGATVGPSSGAIEPVDQRGAFELNGLRPGVYDVVARAPGLAPAVAAEVPVDTRTEARIDLVLRPGARVVGRLVDANERPVTGKVGIGELDGRPIPQLLKDSLAVAAGGDGRFAIDGIPTGTHALGVDAPGFAPQRADVNVGADDRQVDVGDVRLDVGLAIRGRVRSKTGEPLADAVVRSIEVRRDHRRAPDEERTGADGTFVLAGLEAGSHRLFAEAAGFAIAEKTAEPGGEPVEFLLGPAGTISGRVVDARSRPVDSFRVSGEAAESGGRALRMPYANETASEDGRFTLAQAPAGTYVLTVNAPGHGPATLTGVKVAEGAAVDVGTVTLPAGGVLRGTVVDASGAGVAGAAVSAMSQPRGQPVYPVETTSGTAGAFELQGVAPGATFVGASHPSFADAEPVSVEVDPAKPTADLRLTLSAGGRIEGSVRTRDGGGRAGLGVWARPPDQLAPRLSASLSARTAVDGSFALEHVPAGTVHVTVAPPVHGVAGASSARSVEVHDGQTTRLDIVDREIVLSGRATRAGSPLAGLRIDASSAQAVMVHRYSGVPAAPAAGPQPLTATTQEDGSFQMLVDEPGTYGIRASWPDGRTMPARTVVVPDADAHAVELAFDGGGIAGVVVDRDTEAPVAFAEVTAWSKQGGRGLANGQAGADGRFQLEADAGEYMVRARARNGGYAPSDLQKATVADGGLAEVRLTMAKGCSITGRLTTSTGAPAGGLHVHAMWSGAVGSGYGDARTLPDGTFEIGSLEQGQYTLFAEGHDGTFAILPNVSPGAPAALVLRPGARLAVTVTLPTGAPAPGVHPMVARVDGLHAGGNVGGPSAGTDAQGRTQMTVPAGRLLVSASQGTPNGPHQSGSTEVSVAPGEGASIAIRMSEGTTPAQH
jgi:Carboxypeptidase regulatory-like domain